MPTYEYECEACSHKFEQFQSITAEPIKTCPVCRGNVRRLIGTGAGFLFKGSGFYVTDYRSQSYRKKADAEKKQVEPVKKSAGSDSSTSGSQKNSSPSTTNK